MLRHSEELGLKGCAIARLLTCALVTAVLLAAVVAAPAGATVSVSSFSVSPSTTQAGGSPNVGLDVQFSTPNADDVRDVTVSLAPGLYANPTVAQPCSITDLSFLKCAIASRVGEGWVTATVFGIPLPLPATLFLVEPRANEAARLGLVVLTPVGPIVNAAPVTLRTRPDTGLDVVFSGLPRALGPIPITVQRIQLTLSGKVGGRSFTRNPTGCGSATTKVSAVSYDAPGSPATGSDAFTPTGCDSLAYAPTLTATGAEGTADDGIDLSASVVQDAGNAASKSLALTLPNGLFARAATLGRACTASDAATCPDSATVGSATAETPLLANPLAGKLVLVAPAVGLPGVAVVFPAPFPIQIAGSTTFANARLGTAFDNIPDLPLSALRVHFDGGPDSLFYAGPGLCDAPASLVGDFAAHSGKTASLTAPFGIANCRAASVPVGGGSTAAPPNTGAVSGSTTSGSNTGAAVKPTGTVAVRGLASRTPSLSLGVSVPSQAPALKVLKACLPRGLGINVAKLSRGLTLAAGGRRVRGARVRASIRCLTVTLPGTGLRKLTITLTQPALLVAGSLARKVRKGQAGPLTVSLAISDAKGAIKTLKLSGRSR